MLRFLSVLLALALYAVPASAQTPTHYQFRVYAPGGTVPIQKTLTPIASAVCNASASTAPPPVTLKDARGVEWADGNNAGKFCHLDFAAFFGGLPVGSYGFSLVLADATGAALNEESNVTPPLVQLAPSLKSLRVIGG